MSEGLDFAGAVAITALYRVWQTFRENWPFLAASMVAVVVMKTWVDQRRVADFLRRHQHAGVIGATATAVGTPFCSCGTLAVMLGAMAAQMPWAPLVAFMVASPLTSPHELLYAAGLFGWQFAAVFFAASIVLGLAGGSLAAVLEARGWLQNQARFRPLVGGSDTAVPLQGAAPVASRSQVTARSVAGLFLRVAGRLLLIFATFAFVGYFLNGLMPRGWIPAVFGGDRVYGVVVAATLGLPLYLSTLASMPLVRSMIDAGMSEGAALAFLITGAGTSIGAVVGLLTIARWRVIALVVGTLWTGAVFLGHVYNALS